MYSIRNIVINTVITLYGDMVTRLDYGDHFRMYKNIESLCCTPKTNIIL